jgi:hypothetical protein
MVFRSYVASIPEGWRVSLDTELSAVGLESMSAPALLLGLEHIFEVTFPDSLRNATTSCSVKSLEGTIELRPE